MIKTDKPIGRLRNRPLKDYTGQSNNQLTAISLHERYPDKPPKWLFQCSCGGTVITTAKAVFGGKTKSCGCIARKILIERNTTHGLSRIESQTYKVWKDMRGRCYRKNNKDYKDYGARGIIVCDAWNNFETFFNDMGRKPEGLSIDRIDVNGNYEPSNCRWADNETQANNKRNNVKITHNGKEQTIQQWSREVGIDRKTLDYRFKHGLDVFSKKDLRK